MQPHLPCCNVTQYNLMEQEEFSMTFFYQAKVACWIEMILFYYQAIHDEWWGILFFIQVFDTERVDTEKVSPMILLLLIKAKSLSTPHA